MEQLNLQRATIELLNDNDFSWVFEAKSNQNIKSFMSVQTCVKSNRGVGEPIIVKFYAPMDQLKESGQISYNYKSLGEDIDLI